MLSQHECCLWCCVSLWWTSLACFCFAGKNMQGFYLLTDLASTEICRVRTQGGGDGKRHVFRDLHQCSGQEERGELRPAVRKNPFVEAVLTSTAAAVDKQLEDGKQDTLSYPHRTLRLLSVFYFVVFSLVSHEA
ncbi:hypothetical protein CRENBAI_013944 [Crenichthys baileyi]|uniref:Secreted protein n=1 Tax=Crenichthys baileyi TaxID=28760 RepID=A0AAV9RF81_9TELE